MDKLQTNVIKRTIQPGSVDKSPLNVVISQTNDIENSKEFQDKLTKKIEMYDQSTDEQKEQIFTKTMNKKFLYKHVHKIFRARKNNNQ